MFDAGTTELAAYQEAKLCAKRYHQWPRRRGTHA